MLRVGDLAAPSAPHDPKDTFRGVYADVCDLIRLRNAKGGTALRYTVPMFVPGKPAFDRARCTRYVQRKLAAGGFRVVPGDGFVLAVDWGPLPQNVSEQIQLPLPTLPQKVQAQPFAREYHVAPPLPHRMLPNIGPKHHPPPQPENPAAAANNQPMTLSSRLARLKAALGM